MMSSIIYTVTDERSFIQQRYILSIMGFMALAIGYVQRFCLSLAITEMVEHKHVSHSTHSGSVCPVDESVANSTIFQKVTLIFSEHKLKITILSNEK